MPAQSPTLSPTLSAMVAGLRGSSSGMPASTLPTRSPPTSAPLVKMPPPRRAKIEISEAPKPSATSASITVRLIRGIAQRCGQEAEIEGDAEQREARDQHAGDGAGLEGEFEAAGQRRGRGLRGAHIGAHRDVHADEAGRARQHRADQEAGDRHVLAFEIGLRAFAHGAACDFLHPAPVTDATTLHRRTPATRPACPDRHALGLPGRQGVLACGLHAGLDAAWTAGRDKWRRISNAPNRPPRPASASGVLIKRPSVVEAGYMEYRPIVGL
jgi:hypothetical protein